MAVYSFRDPEASIEEPKTVVYYSYALHNDTAYEDGINATLDGAQRFVESEVGDYYGKPVEWRRGSSGTWYATWNEGAHEHRTIAVEQREVGE